MRATHRKTVFVTTIAALTLLASAAGAEVSDPPSPSLAGRIRDTVHRLAPSYGLDPALVIAIVRAESAFDPNAVSAKNARGLMQLTPETATRFGVRDSFDSAQNLHGGMSYLRWLLDRFDGKTTLALAAYNAGEGAVLRYSGVPPFPETLDYITKVHRYYAAGDLAAWPHAAPKRRTLPVVCQSARNVDPRRRPILTPL